MNTAAASPAGFAPLFSEEYALARAPMELCVTMGRHMRALVVAVARLPRRCAHWATAAAPAAPLWLCGAILPPCASAVAPCLHWAHPSSHTGAYVVFILSNYDTIRLGRWNVKYEETNTQVDREGTPYQGAE